MSIGAFKEEKENSREKDILATISDLTTRAKKCGLFEDLSPYISNLKTDNPKIVEKLVAGYKLYLEKLTSKLENLTPEKSANYIEMRNLFLKEMQDVKELLNGLETGNRKILTNDQHHTQPLAVLFIQETGAKLVDELVANKKITKEKGEEIKKEIYKQNDVGGLFQIAEKYGILNPLLERMKLDYQKAMEEYKKLMQEAEGKKEKEASKPPSIPPAGQTAQKTADALTRRTSKAVAGKFKPKQDEEETPA
ncbi:hypothetical protein AUJ17_04495 [Candidatus Micrarchaeota archaeon CG1_02_47_40]|nr:MAG: hypothetical protein AUJ17_04495 [Candidatus Micrarchaeota archaeon CG1_02_47_40]